MIVVVKVGTSSITDSNGAIVDSAIEKLCDEVAEQTAAGNEIIVVSSGATSAGLVALGLDRDKVNDSATLQAGFVVGQAELVQKYREAFMRHKLRCGEVLLTSLDFVHRMQYLYARNTLSRLLQLGVVPVINEIRFGGNDRLAALVAHMMRADLLVLLTDTPGMFTIDPRLSQEASLIEEIVEIDQALEAAAGGAGSGRGTGGMASKLAAAKIAAWSGVPAVIAAADRPAVLAGAINKEQGVGTYLHPREHHLRARKLWIAFAIGSSGTIVVDDGARTALTERGTSLLPAGITDASGSFGADDAVEIADTSGAVFAKGLARHGIARIKEWKGKKTSELPEDASAVIVHRDDLVVLP